MYKRREVEAITREKKKKKRQNITIQNRMSKRHKVSKVQERRYEKKTKVGRTKIKKDKDR